MVAGSETRWQYLERAVHVIRGNLTALRQALTIISDSNEWMSDAQAVSSAKGLLTHLSSLEFLFLLVLYDDIFSITGKLYQKLQSKTLDVAIAVTSVVDCQEQLKRLRTEEAYKVKMDQSAELAGESAAPRKRRRKEWGDCLPYGTEAAAGATGADDTLQRVHHEALDQCIQALGERFKDHSVLQICELLARERYGSFNQSRPTAQLQSLQRHYGALFDLDMLQNELKAVWGSTDMHLAPQQLLQHMKRQGLTDAFPETHRLCLLILTIKPTTVSEERSFSVLKRVKTYLRSTMSQDRLSYLSKLQIEAPLLSRLQKDGVLYESVIERFGHQKDRNIKLFFR
ncbi:Zinc finger MYM-type protein 1 [Amphibalanus amphitrite]|uniref:Zinc finger MYM-type protein 1 n=1 Tax=Amphibalanus amphitrite TaxID=1232801 RepID=A0A6A4VIY0_AMPAM|nr:Zinc finger MYM-type protein 1 [Amphibalanus amphitrite]